MLAMRDGFDVDEKETERLSRIRSKVVTLRVTEGDHLRYSKIAERVGLSLSDFFRTSLDASSVTGLSAPRAKVKTSEPVRKADIELLTALNRIGNNVNQIAKAFHLVGYSEGEICSITLLSELEKIEGQLERMIYQNEKALNDKVEEMKNELIAKYEKKESSNHDG